MRCCPMGLVQVTYLAGKSAIGRIQTMPDCPKKFCSQWVWSNMNEHFQKQEEYIEN